MDAPALTKQRAKRLRQAMTLPEVLLWERLRRRGVGGVRFRRQHAMGPYILDFFCVEAKLCVEVDGQGHGMGDRPDHDERRDAWLAKQGVRTLRLRAAFVLGDMDGALRTVAAALEEGEGRT